MEAADSNKAAEPVRSAPRAVATLDHLPRLPVGDDPIRPYAPACATFRTFLRRHGLKFTPERAAILDVVLKHESLFHADAIVEALKGHENRGSRATVYRTLAHLQDAGLLRSVAFDGARQGYYEVVTGARGPNDYLVDAETGEVIQLSGEEMRKARDAVCRALGYEPVRHHFYVYARKRRDDEATR